MSDEGEWDYRVTTRAREDLRALDAEVAERIVQKLEEVVPRSFARRRNGWNRLSKRAIRSWSLVIIGGWYSFGIRSRCLRFITSATAGISMTGCSERGG